MGRIIIGVLVWIGVFSLSLFVLNWNYVEKGLKNDLRSGLWELRDSVSNVSNNSLQNGLYSNKTNIFFLKTHKCASSTVQNILMRFGYQRNLDFVLPLNANYLGHPIPFNRAMIPEVLLTPSKTFNIFTHHTRYNNAEIKAIMKDDTIFVTILRHPANLYESLYQFYSLEKKTNVTLRELINSPNRWSAIRSRSSKERIGTNQMAFDLGFPLENITKQQLSTRQFIQKIDEEFDLVMITEYMEASLVLLCDVMNWPLEYAASLKLNSRQSRKQVLLTYNQRQSLLNINSVDSELYTYFFNKFRSRVKEYGADRMKQKVNELLRLNSNLWKTCVDKTNNKGYARTQNYDLRNKGDYLCFYAAKPELSFTDEIRNDQIRRLSVQKHLDDLLDDN